MEIMLDNETEKTGSFGVSGFVVGLLTGALIAGVAVFLFAPRSGKETREMIKSKAMETQQKIQSQVSGVKDKVNQIRTNMQNRAEQEAQAVDKTK